MTLKSWQFQKGQPAWNKGKKVQSNTGRTHFKNGCIPWNKDKFGYSTSRKGQKHTPETIKKISLSRQGKNLGNTHGFIKGQTSWNKGKIDVYSKESREKMSKSRKGKYPKSYYAKLGAISTAKQNKIKEPTSIEKKVYNELKLRGLLFETQKLIKGKFVVDAYIPSLNLVIEADGDYWHSLEENKNRDKSKNAYLSTCGYNLLRLSETEINDGSFKNKLRRVLN